MLRHDVRWSLERRVLDLVKAVLAGMVSNIVRKLGPSIILFFYLWVHHSKFYDRLGGTLAGLSVNVWLAGCAILLGVAALAFKDTVAAFSRRMDRKAMPLLHAWVLRKVTGGDLMAVALQRPALDLLMGLKSLAVFTLLIVFAAFTFPVFSVVLTAVIIAVSFLSWQAANKPAAPATAPFFTKLATHPEYYAEILVVAGLIIAFMAMATNSSLISGTVFILIVARFSNEIKIMAKSIVNVLRARQLVAKIWQNRAEAAERRRRRQAEADARKAEKQAEAAALRPAKAKTGSSQVSGGPSRLPAA